MKDIIHPKIVRCVRRSPGFINLSRGAYQPFYLGITVTFVRDSESYVKLSPSHTRSKRDHSSQSGNKF